MTNCTSHRTSCFLGVAGARCIVVVIAAFLAASPDGPAVAQVTPAIPSDTLAIVGPSAIQALELIERIELMPWQGKENPASRDSAKIRALQSLVAEELLALEAAAAGLGTDSQIVARTRDVERLMVRDALYHREVRNNVSVSQEELRRGLQRYGRQLTVVALATRSTSDAEKLAAALAARPDSTRQRLSGSLITRRDTALVTLGKLEEPFEDVVFALTPAQPASDPLVSPRGESFIFVLVDSSPDPAATSESPVDRRLRVEHILRQRKEAIRARDYAVTILEPEQARVNPELFHLVARTIIGTLRSNPPGARTSRGYSLSAVIDAVMEQLIGVLTRECVTLRHGSIPLRDILATYRYVDVVFPTLDEKDFRSRLNSAIREAVEIEIMAREGYRQGLQNTEEVRHDVHVWTKAWLAGAMQENIASAAAVSDQEVFRYLIGRSAAIGRLYEVNIREVLCDSLARSLNIMGQLTAGADLGELAWRYSRRSAWAARRGESGFFRVSDHPDIGFAALAADTGTLVGPLRVEGGYSLFTVIGKRNAPGGESPPFDSLFTALRFALSSGQQDSAVNSFLAERARFYNVRMYYSRLRNVGISPSNMVTKRMIGFGGTMIAVPSLVPRWEWMYESEDLKYLLP